MLKSLFLAVGLLFIAGCATTYVEQSPTETQPVNGVQIIPWSHDDTVPSELVDGIKQSLENQLHNQHQYTKSDHLTIQFKILDENDPRGFWSTWWKGEFPDGDKQMLNVGVMYSDQLDSIVGEIEVEVEVKPTANEAERQKAMQAIASQITDFTLQHFPYNSI